MFLVIRSPTAGAKPAVFFCLIPQAVIRLRLYINPPPDTKVRNIMRVNPNKLIVRRYFEEVLSDGRRDLVDEMFAPEICDLVKRYAFFEARSFDVSAVIAEGDTVMVHWHKSQLADEQSSQNGFAVFHLADGKIIGLEMIDFNGILRQIGAEVLS